VVHRRQPNLVQDATLAVLVRERRGFFVEQYEGRGLPARWSTLTVILSAAAAYLGFAFLPFGSFGHRHKLHKPEHRGQKCSDEEEDKQETLARQAHQVFLACGTWPEATDRERCPANSYLADRGLRHPQRTRFLTMEIRHARRETMGE